MRNKIGFLSSKSKYIGLLIILCVLVNGFVPRFGYKTNNYIAACQIALDRAAFFMHFSNLTNISLKIANELFNKFTSQTKQQSRKKNKVDSLSDNSIISFEKKCNSSKYFFNVLIEKLVRISFSIKIKIPDISEKYSFNVSSKLHLIPLILLFIIFLPRRNVNEEVTLTYIQKNYYYNPTYNLSWIFYCFIVSGIPNLLGFKRTRINSGFHKDDNWI